MRVMCLTAPNLSQHIAQRAPVCTGRCIWPLASGLTILLASQSVQCGRHAVAEVLWSLCYRHSPKSFASPEEIRALEMSFTILRHENSP